MAQIFCTVLSTMALALASACFTVSAQAGTGLVTQDPTALRGAANDTAPVLTTLWRGDTLELRGERGDYLQVWDHGRERGGYVRKSQVMAVGSDEAAARDLMAVLRYVRDQPGAEAFGLGLASAALQAAPASMLAESAGAELLDAIGQQAERLAARASAGAPPRAQDQAALTAHLDIAARQGVRFQSREADGRVLLCYDGEAYRRLLAMKQANSEQRARAALALTRPECLDSAATPRVREEADNWRAEVLDRASNAGDAALPAHWKNRVAARRAAVWSSLAFARARRGDALAAQAAADRALRELAAVTKTDLADDDLVRFNEAAMRVNAVRWAATPLTTPSPGLAITTTRTDDGQTCVSLTDSHQPGSAALAQRCTWGIAWVASSTSNRERTALALAVQPVDGWRELWVFRKDANEWSVNVLPPNAAAPGVGYAEFAGWVPGGQQMLVAREAIAEGRTLRRFEVLKLDTLTAERQASEPSVLGAFNRWTDAAWKRDSTAMR